MGNTLFFGSMGERRGLNPRHAEPQTAALPTELRPPSEVQKYHFIFSHAKRISNSLNFSRDHQIVTAPNYFPHKEYTSY